MPTLTGGMNWSGNSPAQERQMDLIILVPWEAATKVSVAKRCVGSSSFSAARPGSREEERSDCVAQAPESFFHSHSVTQTPTWSVDPGGPTKVPSTGGTDSGNLATATAK